MEKEKDWIWEENKAIRDEERAPGEEKQPVDRITGTLETARI